MEHAEHHFFEGWEFARSNRLSKLARDNVPVLQFVQMIGIPLQHGCSLLEVLSFVVDP